MVDNAIGIFDSGLGGLTALQAFREIMPNENIIYFGDTLNVPYGTKSVEQLNVLAKNNIDFLKSKGVKAIIAACGTVSSNCKNVLNNSGIYVENVLDASLAYLKNTSGKIAVIATEATIKSGAFKLDGRDIVGVACPEFVTLIENGHTSKEDKNLNEAIDKYLAPVRDADVLVLGCTHYGIIEEALRQYMGNDVEIVSCSKCASRAMAEYIKANCIDGGYGETTVYTSGDTDVFDTIAERIIDVKRCNYIHALRP